MEDRIGRIDEIPVAGRAVFVEAHAEFPVRVDGPRRDVEQERVKTQAEGLAAFAQGGDGQVGCQVVTAFHRAYIVVEMLAARPCRPIEQVK